MKIVKEKKKKSVVLLFTVLLLSINFSCFKMDGKAYFTPAVLAGVEEDTEVFDEDSSDNLGINDSSTEDTVTGDTADEDSEADDTMTAEEYQQELKKIRENYADSNHFRLLVICVLLVVCVVMIGVIVHLFMTNRELNNDLESLYEGEPVFRKQKNSENEFEEDITEDNEGDKEENDFNIEEESLFELEPPEEEKIEEGKKDAGKKKNKNKNTKIPETETTEPESSHKKPPNVDLEYVDFD